MPYPLCAVIHGLWGSVGLGDIITDWVWDLALTKLNFPMLQGFTPLWQTRQLKELLSLPNVVQSYGPLEGFHYLHQWFLASVLEDPQQAMFWKFICAMVHSFIWMPVVRFLHVSMECPLTLHPRQRLLGPCPNPSKCTKINLVYCMEVDHTRLDTGLTPHPHNWLLDSGHKFQSAPLNILYLQGLSIHI